jgi:hypothetical protein
MLGTLTKCKESPVRKKRYDHQDVNDALESGEFADAEEFLLAVMPEAEKEFQKVDKALVEFLKKVKQHFPNAQYYTASGGFHLLIGPSHGDAQGHGDTANYQFNALDGKANIGDGDW